MAHSSDLFLSLQFVTVDQFLQRSLLLRHKIVQNHPAVREGGREGMREDGVSGVSVRRVQCAQVILLMYVRVCVCVCVCARVHMCLCNSPITGPSVKMVATTSDACDLRRCHTTQHNTCQTSHSYNKRNVRYVHVH